MPANRHQVRLGEDLHQVVGLFGVDGDELARRTPESVGQSCAAAEEAGQEGVGPATIGSLQLQARAQLVHQRLRDFGHLDLEQHLLRGFHRKQVDDARRRSSLSGTATRGSPHVGVREIQHAIELHGIRHTAGKYERIRRGADDDVPFSREQLRQRCAQRRGIHAHDHIHYRALAGPIDQNEVGGADALPQQVDFLRAEQHHVHVGDARPVGFGCRPRGAASSRFERCLDLDRSRRSPNIRIAQHDAGDRSLQLDQGRLAHRDADGRPHVHPVTRR